MKAIDLRAALDTLGAISESASNDSRFARHAVAGLARLVPADLTTLSICDLEAGHRSVVSDVSGAISRRQIEAFDRHFHEHPLVRAHGHNPAATTRRISDLVSPSEFRATSLYNEYYRAIGVEHAMAVPIHVHRHELVSFVLNRSGRDFTDRDRACLESIRPHLGNIFRMTRAIESARAAWGVPPTCQPSLEDVPLTAREREVFQWLARGKTDKDIAEILAISPRTVHKHLQRIYEKLGVETRTAAVARLHSETR
ncbi:MAG TPA: helix-turn-helix transcriptional regulator [Usitatibacter sp.]|nr:helix-turn-helix transcriptional regulator [Usitatibacter sp.]